MRETDTDNDGVVSFAELVSLMHKLKKDPNSSNLFVRKIHKAPAQVRDEGLLPKRVRVCDRPSLLLLF